MLLIITISTFVCFTFGGLAVYWLMFRPASAATERLRRMSETERGLSPAASVGLAAPVPEDGAMSALAERVAKPLQRLAPPSAAEARKLQKQLMQAGYRSPSAPVTFRAIQLCALVGLPGMVAFACAVTARPFSSAV